MIKRVWYKKKGKGRVSRMEFTSLRKSKRTEKKNEGPSKI
jgi:hypothetical protein